MCLRELGTFSYSDRDYVIVVNKAVEKVLSQLINAAIIYRLNY